ncbi:MAG: PQQ-binding-like beta-propeller repeat protein [Thermoanaerobaculia bacterium]
MDRHARGLCFGPRSRRYFFPGLLVVLLVGVASCAAGRAGDWITVNKDYSSQRYVDLDHQIKPRDQITPANVGNLKEVCELQLNAATWFNSGLLMVGRTIYVNTLRSTYALDAATCEVIWQYDIAFTPWLATISNRGAAYLNGKIFRGTADGRVIALDAEHIEKGKVKVKWDVQAADPTRKESFTAAPVAWMDKAGNGRVFIGIVTADLGVRGRLMAFDAETGKELWRFNTVPIGNEKGAETWPPGPAAAPPAGGAFWTSFSLDPKTGELFGPVSNPYPDYVRVIKDEKGNYYQNLYTNSIISLDAATGKLNWYFQAIKGDDHDWDLGAPPTLYSTPSGKSMLAVAGKEGFVFRIDRTSKEQVFPKTPGTTIANTEPLDDSLRLVCPGSLGGAQWTGTAYHQELGILYTGMVDFCFYYSNRFYGADPGFWESPDQMVRADFSKPPRGWITAINGETGEVLWKYHAEAQVLAGLVPTKSGLLFAGDVRGNLLALDAKSGTVLKSIDAGGALNNGLISYAVQGKQYVAAAVGGLTLNPAGVSGPLRVVVYGLQGSDPPKVVKVKPRAPITPIPLPGFVCGGCHGFQGEGYSYPPLLRHTELVNTEVLKDFLSSVPPPMPILYQPDGQGLLDETEVGMIAAYLKYVTSAENPKNNQVANSAPPGYVYKPPVSGGTPAWQKVYSVLTNQRCINCHTVTNYPRQTDVRYPHIFSVVRGADDKGAPVARCTSCHGTANDPLTGIPGAPNWRLAPLTMAWESAPGIPMKGPELCETLKDRLNNGDRSLADLLGHLKDERLVQWAWEPGTRWNKVARTTPPISHPKLVESFESWMKEGAPCPTGDR